MWHVALNRLAELTGSSHAQLIGVGGPREVSFNYVPAMPMQATQDFISIAGGSPQVNARMAAVQDAQVMQCVTDQMLEGYRKRIVNDNYSDFKSTYQIPFGCQTSLFRENERLIALVLLRSAAQGYTTTEQLEVFNYAAAFARSAVRVQQAMDRHDAMVAAQYLSPLNAPTFLCDGLANVISRNSASDAMIAAGLLRFDRDRLAAADEHQTARLRHAVRLAAATRPDAMAEEHSIIIRDGDGRNPVVLDLFPVRNAPGSPGGARVLGVARYRMIDNRRRIALLVDAYGLTQAEAVSACGLIDGLSRRDIARQRGVSEATVNTQIKSLFLKCEVQREAQLVALLRGLLQD